MTTTRGERAATLDEEHEQLAAALGEAERVAARFTENWTDNVLSPTVGIELSIGADDLPLFVFTISIVVADDLAIDDYPLDELQRLATHLRSTLALSPVADWSWHVTARRSVA